MRRSWLAAISAIVALALVAGVYSQRVTQSPASQEQSTFYSAVSPQGLQLQVRLNTSSIRSGGALTAQVSLFNTLSKNVSFVLDPSAMKKIGQWDSSELGSICGSNTVFDTFSFSLFRGRYTPANLSQATEPLQLIPFTPHCGGFIGEQRIQEIMFAPNSDNATVTGSVLGSGHVWKAVMEINASTEYCSLTTGTVTQTQTKNGTESTSILLVPSTRCYSVPSLNGYWVWPKDSSCVLIVDGVPTDEKNPLHCNFHQFAPGHYTLVAEDIFGHTLFAYFEVA